MQITENQRIKTQIVGKKSGSKKPTNCAVNSASNRYFSWARGYKEKALKPLDFRALLNYSTFICGMDGTNSFIVAKYHKTSISNISTFYAIKIFINYL